MSKSNDGEGTMGQTATKPAPKLAAEGAPASPADIAGEMLREVREQSAQMLAETQRAAAAMLEAARQEAADINAQARAAIEEAKEQAEVIASDDPKVKAKHAVEQGRREFERATSGGDGRVWLQNEVEEGFEPVLFKALGPRPHLSELRVLRIGRHEYSHAGRTEISPGVAYQFVRGEFEALSEDVAEYLKSRPSFNVTFCEVGEEPDTAPDSRVVMRRVLDATFELDDSALRELFEKEKASHNRKDVLDAIVHARRQIRGKTGTTTPDAG